MQKNSEGGNLGITFSVSTSNPLVPPPRPQGPAFGTGGLLVSATELCFPAALKGKGEGEGKL